MNGEKAAVHSVHRFVFTVPDLGVARQFYTTFGLDVTGDGKRLDLRTFGNTHVWASVVQGGERKRLRYVSYGIHARDEAQFKRLILEQGIGIAPHPLALEIGQEPGLWLQSPDGTAIALTVSPKVSPSAPTVASATALPAPGRGAAPARSQVPQVRPRYLSHILQFTPDVPRMRGFCEAVLGLRLSDHAGDLIAFLHSPHGSDHHLVAFAKSHAPGLHHSSWDVGGIDEVGQGMDQMRRAGWGQGWGVGRHVLGSNYFNYVEDPWGSYCEYSSGIDFVPAGFDWPAQDHPPEDSLFVWGPEVPAHFITNHEQPVPYGPAGTEICD